MTKKKKPIEERRALTLDLRPRLLGRLTQGEKEHEQEADHALNFVSVAVCPRNFFKGFGDAEIKEIMTILSQFTCPMIISFDRNKMSGEKIKIIAELLRHRKSKTAFLLAHCGLIDEDAEILIENVGDSPFLFSLCLKHNLITDLGAARLSNFLNDYLRKIPWWDWFKISVEGNPINQVHELIFGSWGRPHFTPEKQALYHQAKMRYITHWFNSSVTLFQGHRQPQSPLATLEAKHISQISSFFAPSFLKPPLINEIQQTAEMKANIPLEREEKNEEYVAQSSCDVCVIN